MLRALAIVFALAVPAVAAACGSEEQQPAADAQDLLARAFAEPVESGRMNARVELELDGVPALGNGLELRLSGPFTRTEADLEITAAGFGPGFSGGVTVTEDNLYIAFAGQSYELGQDDFRQGQRDARDVEIDLASWLRDARVEGEDQLDGEPVTKIAAQLDVAKALEDMARLARGKQVDDVTGFVEDATVELWVARADDTVRRALLDLEFEIPEDARGDFGGAEGGAVKADVRLTDVGRPQRIRPPADARPLDDLLRQFGLGPELFEQ